MGGLLDGIIEIILKLAVFLKGFTAGNKRQYLVGYYISKSGVGEKEITDYLSSKLPAYMVPVYFVKMDGFPLNMNGKCGRPGFNLWVGKIPWRREQRPTPVFWPGDFMDYTGSQRIGHNWVTFTFTYLLKKISQASNW